jgi:hypothetical protein
MHPLWLLKSRIDFGYRSVLRCSARTFESIADGVSKNPFFSSSESSRPTPLSPLKKLL